MKREIVYAAIAAAGMILSGCTKKIYVPVEHLVQRVDTLARTRDSRDTLLMRDSIVVKMAGDTVVMESWKVRERIKVKSDTVYRSLADTVRIRESMPHNAGWTSPTGCQTGKFGWMFAGLLVVLLAVWLRRK